MTSKNTVGCTHVGAEDTIFDMLKYRIVTNSFGTRLYYNAVGQAHREGGPAIETAAGDRYWYCNGKLHREDGPAVIYGSGTRKWLLNGALHRTDGPAIEWADGDCEWWLFDVRYSLPAYREKLCELGGMGNDTGQRCV